MPVPISQMWTVASYVVGQRLRGNKHYALTLMLEPLFRCNLACAGCGKIQYPPHILKRQLTPEQCWKAAEDCRAPVVAIPGGEPLLHPQIKEIVEGLVARKKYVYVCTNALLLKQRLEEGIFKPSKFLSFSVHMDGQEEHHDFAVCREGTYQTAVEAIRLAVGMGFRVTTNTTLFDGADPSAVRAFFDEMMALGVEGMMVSPGYAYPKAPDQKSFLSERRKTNDLFSMILSNRKRGWRFNMSPLFLEFLMGKREYECTPWGMPTYNIFGWQRPCYLLQDGYADTYQELIQSTQWANYGRASGNKACQQCMVHSGYEASAVHHTFSGIGGIWANIRALLSGGYADAKAAQRLSEESKKPHGPLVQLGITARKSDREEVAA
ncbi:MAG: hopanoid biosynthesis associated radical SAM protein HpnH [Planctomyces sp.]|nr:hopanoid biosynthesis associated radical SAM protein HpnH [Planctomyces sp.]MBA4038848.1 hopanoid biosynthesis associated radical SAM protein HpnH [Planctomyces sp.]MBA4119199.1 hopanoid biosynthesis associated radical SAM protein HpnH [Isosphaera sp.]